MGTITQTITTNQLVVGDGIRTENAKSMETIMACTFARW